MQSQWYGLRLGSFYPHFGCVHSLNCILFHVFETTFYVNNGYVAKIYVNDCTNILNVGVSNLLNHSPAIVAYFY